MWVGKVDLPPPFLKTVVKHLDEVPGFAGVCAGFEGGDWRFDQLAEHLIEWLPDFALNSRERLEIGGSNARRALREAARAIYTSDKYERRGEVGEILLHAIVRQEFHSNTAINKVYFKDAPNDTVKGFDAVHLVDGSSGLELWLGEVKLYKDLAEAVRDVVQELRDHTRIPYMRTEFAAILHKIDKDHPRRSELEALLDPNVSLDEIVAQICIPVLLTYDSATVNSHARFNADYELAISNEFAKHRARFAAASLPNDIRIILILVPMNTKAKLLDSFDRKLKGLLA